MRDTRCHSCIFPGADPAPIFAGAELNIISMVAVVSEISMAGPNNSAAMMGSRAGPVPPGRSAPLPPPPHLSLSPCSPLSLNICGCRKQKHLARRKIVRLLIGVLFEISIQHIVFSCLGGRLWWCKVYYSSISRSGYLRNNPGNMS